MTKRFHIVRIADHYTVLINGGSLDGLKIGDKLTVWDEDHATEIVDEASNSSLGKYPAKKAIIKVSECFDKFSVCVNNDSSISDVFAKSNAIGLALKQNAQRSSLNVKDDEIEELTFFSKFPIKNGDKATLEKQ